MELDAKDEEGNDDLMEFNERNVFNPQSPWFHLLFDDDEDEKKLCDIKITRNAEYIGRGNARQGFRRPYILYHPSAVYERVTSVLFVVVALHFLLFVS